MGERRMSKKPQRSFFLTEEQDARARRAAELQGDCDGAGNPQWSTILRAQLDEYVLSAFRTYVLNSGNVEAKLLLPASKQWIEDALAAGNMSKLRSITRMSYGDLDKVLQHHGIKVTT